MGFINDYTNWAQGVVSKYPQPLQKATGAITGAIGSAINTVRPTGNISLGIANNMQRLGGALNPVKTAYASEGDVLGTNTGGQSTNNASLLPGASSVYTPPSNTGGGSGGGSSQFPADQYIGWDPTAAQYDWEAKQRSAGDDAARREAEARSAIEGGYNQYQTNLQGLQGTFQAGQQDELGSASRTFDQIFGGLEDQKATNMSKLEAGRGAVQTRKAQSVKDLQQNLSNTLRGASMSFGAMGAGDTSATRTMLPYAYTKLAGAEQSKIENQSNQQLFEIDQQERDTELEFTNMWRQTEIDKESRVSDIKKYYGDRIATIQTAMAQAPLDKARDLAGLSQALLQEAMANLRQLEAEDRQSKENAKQWATQRMAQLNDYKLQLGGTANFQPQDIVWNELSAAQAMPQSRGQETFYNPLLAQRRRQDYLGA